MSITDKFSIVVLFLLIGTQLSGRHFLNRYVKLCFFSAAAAMLGSAVYSSFFQYQAWKGNSMFVFLLPPHASWTYFASYVFSRFFAPLFISLVFALALKRISEFLNRRYGERFLEKEESWLMATGIFMAGYPGFLFYLPIMLVSGLFLSLFYSAVKKGRAPFFYLWLPTAVFAILLKSQIPQSVLNNFII